MQYARASHVGSVIKKSICQAGVRACMLIHFSGVWLLATLWTVAYQALSVRGILQVRILEWIARPLARGSFWPRDPTSVFLQCKQILYHWGNLPSGRYRFDSWVGNMPWRRKWQPTPVFLPGKSYRQRSLAGYSPWGGKETQLSNWAQTDTIYKEEFRHNLE